MDEQQHEDDHRWISERRHDQRRWDDRKDNIVKATLTWLVISLITGIGAVFAYAAKTLWGGK